MDLSTGVVLAGLISLILLGALFVPGTENRELVRTLGFILALWTILFAVLQ